MKIKLLTYLTCLILLSNCGFEVVNKKINYKISEISTAGDQRINYKLKNSLNHNINETDGELIDVKISTKKIKNIKEKNIKNEITKYEIKIDVNVILNIINEEKIKSFMITKTGDYVVASQYSQTLINERNLINLLTDEISEEIINNIIGNLNEL